MVAFPVPEVADKFGCERNARRRRCRCVLCAMTPLKRCVTALVASGTRHLPAVFVSCRMRTERSPKAMVRIAAIVLIYSIR